MNDKITLLVRTPSGRLLQLSEEDLSQALRDGLIDPILQAKTELNAVAEGKGVDVDTLPPAPEDPIALLRDMKPGDDPRPLGPFRPRGYRSMPTRRSEQIAKTEGYTVHPVLGLEPGPLLQAQEELLCALYPEDTLRFV